MDNIDVNNLTDEQLEFMGFSPDEIIKMREEKSTIPQEEPAVEIIEEDARGEESEESPNLEKKDTEEPVKIERKTQNVMKVQTERKTSAGSYTEFHLRLPLDISCCLFALSALKHKSINKIVLEILAQDGSVGNPFEEGSEDALMYDAMVRLYMSRFRKD